MIKGILVLELEVISDIETEACVDKEIPFINSLFEFLEVFFLLLFCHFGILFL